MKIDARKTIIVDEDALNEALNAWAKKTFPDAGAQAKLTNNPEYGPDDIFVELMSEESMRGDAFNALFKGTDFDPELELCDESRYCELPEEVSTRLLLRLIAEETGFAAAEIYPFNSCDGVQRFIVFDSVENAPRTYTLRTISTENGEDVRTLPSLDDAKSILATKYAEEVKSMDETVDYLIDDDGMFAEICGDQDYKCWRIYPTPITTAEKLKELVVKAGDGLVRYSVELETTYVCTRYLDQLIEQLDSLSI